MKQIKRFNKAQAALEFLTTYGWAFLVILIMIGALAYFGILSPSKLLPNRCNFGSEFVCDDYRITSETPPTTTPPTPAKEFRIRLKNNVGEAVTVASIVIGSETPNQFECTAPTMPTNWPSGKVEDLVWTACNPEAAGVGFVSGEKAKILVTVNWYPTQSGTNYAKVTKGEVFATVI